MKYASILPFLLTCIACLVIGGFVGYLLHARGVVPDPTIDARIAAAEDGERIAQHRIDSLMVSIARRDSLERIEDRLHLTEIAVADSLRDYYERIHAAIPTADARGLRKLTDSLMSGYRRDFSRYRALLDSTRYGLLHAD